MEAPKATDEVQQSDYGSQNDRESSQEEEDKHSIGHIVELEDPIEIENRSSQEEENISLDSHDKL